MKSLISITKKVIVVDHHFSSMNDIGDALPNNCFFDMDRSGATLAWAYFHSGISSAFRIGM